ncbi:response regulator [Paenibacillus sp. LHD-117]|uniref:response regulator transcription factor n=1 Tax=Paenibacillus sp. LHD-117 TaxID=3071412 RepID=UPI0027E161DC|nr:response regulator [Paenibacillus sp. LHD-117]MDQ6418859.1 response regulator [Paenibacillus sp. LHD-117]
MKLLIVDDEVIIRTGLSTVIKWEENGIALLAPAASAEEALMRIPLEKPDIVLTDIRMTGMTGLEMAQEIKRDYPEIEIVVLSGHDDFAYAQQAIRSGISDYLLKTSRPGDIMSAVMKARGKIASSRAALQEGEAHQTAFRWKLLDRLLRSDHPLEEAEAREVLSHYPELRLGSEWETIELWMISPLSSMFVHEQWKQPLRLIGDKLRDSLNCAILDWNNGWLLFFRAGQPGASRTVRAAIDAIARVVDALMFTVIGQQAPGIGGLRESLKTAEQAVAYRWLMGGTGVLDYEDIKHRRGMRTVCTQEEEAALIAVLRGGDEAALKKWIADTLVAIRNDGEATPSTMTSYLHSVLVAGFRWLERAAESVGQSAQGIQELEQPDAKQLAERPEEAMDRILSAIVTEYKRLNGGRNEAIERTLAYIREHLDQSLTLSQVAASIHMNPNYFSKLFKQETGKTYIEYVTEARMEWAVRLLRETPAKVSEIAKRVGYEDLKHFNHLFKRHTGATPSQFRQG